MKGLKKFSLLQEIKENLLNQLKIEKFVFYLMLINYNKKSLKD